MAHGPRHQDNLGLDREYVQVQWTTSAERRNLYPHEAFDFSSGAPRLRACAKPAGMTRHINYVPDTSESKLVRQAPA